MNGRQCLLAFAVVMAWGAGCDAMANGTNETVTSETPKDNHLFNFVFNVKFDFMNKNGPNKTPSTTTSPSDNLTVILFDDKGDLTDHFRRRPVRPLPTASVDNGLFRFFDQFMQKRQFERRKRLI
jgi:hypothetical protein